jgi:hypothetical protein
MNHVLAGILLPLTVIAYYTLSCLFWPYAKCRRCDGGGKFRSPSGKAWRLCRRCAGTGGRLRIGRRIFNYFHRLRRDS